MFHFDPSESIGAGNSFLQNPLHPCLTDDEYEFISRAVNAGCAVSALGRKPGARSKDDVNYSARTTAKPLMSRLNNMTDTHSIFLETGVGRSKVSSPECRPAELSQPRDEASGCINL